MTGSEKQIKWAEDIKAEMIAILNKTPDQMPEQHRDATRQMMQLTIERLDVHDAAKWWIDNRDLATTTQRIIRAVWTDEEWTSESARVQAS